MTKEALKLALEALEYRGVGSWRKKQPAITAIKEALAQPEPPPECKTEAEKTAYAFGWFKSMEAQRTWVGLTDIELLMAYGWKDFEAETIVQQKYRELVLEGLRGVEKTIRNKNESKT